MGRALDVFTWPAEQAFRAASALRNLAYDRAWLPSTRAPIPVVSVGNLGVGGAGKTPFAAWLADRLRAWGHRPAVVLRGYGEDEVQVHRELNPGVPVFANVRRAHAVAAAAAEGCSVAVLDDGFQHRALARDLNLVLIPVEGWRARRKLLPRGPWREEIAALRRADVIVLTRKVATAAQAAEVVRQIAAAAGDRPLVDCRILPTSVRPLHAATGNDVPLSHFVGRDVLAVAALANPHPFFQHLIDVGARVELVSFPDHYAFSPADAVRLAERAAGRPLLMTLKDAVKLRTILPPSIPAYVLAQQVRIGAGAEALEAALQAVPGRTIATGSAKS